MFDTYSQHGAITGVLVFQEANTMLYVNTRKTDSEKGTVSNIKSGHSYELVVCDEDPISIDFESEHGAGDGVTDQDLLRMLCHRNEAILKLNYTEERSLALRALKMAVDALNKGQIKK